MDQWDLREFNEAHRHQPVFNILLTAYGNFENQDTPAGRTPTNMWAIFLHTIDDESVQLEMTHDARQPDADPRLKVRSRPHIGTYNSVKTSKYPVLAQPTIQHVLDLISANGRERFRFAFDQEGCRHWSQTIVFDMETAGVIAAGSGAAATIDLGRYWQTPAGSGYTPRPIVQGNFY